MMMKLISAFSKISKPKKKSSHRTPLASHDESAVLHRDFCYPSTRSATPVSFGLFNRKGDGKVKKNEFEAALRRLEPTVPPTDEELASVVHEIYREGDDYITVHELGTIFPRQHGLTVSSDELRDAFTIFDKDGDGKISAAELKVVFVELGNRGCTLVDCRRMIRGVDGDGDGFVSFGDFVRMMNGHP